MLPFLYCTAFIWVLGQGPQLAISCSACKFSFLPTPQGLLYLCLATGSGISLCQIHFWEDLFSVKKKDK